MVVGRFVVRARALRSTTYLLTTQRALVVQGRRVTAEPAAAGPSSVERTKSGAHVTVTYGSSIQSTDNDGVGRSQPAASWSGRDLSGRLTFKNVTNVYGLLAAMRQAVVGAT